MKLYLAVLTLFLFANNNVLSVSDGLAKTPPMGWSSWNTFFEENNEEKMQGIADAVVDLGLNEYGYVYLTVDDYWNLPDRDENGDMQTNLDRFPSGMKALGEYLHDRGLKFGIYSDAGGYTCGDMAGSLGYEEQDLQLFLEFEIDYLKYDNCYPAGNETNINKNNIDFKASVQNLPSFYQSPPEEERFRPMAEALEAAKAERDILFELCLYGWGNVEEWGPDMGHLARTGYDAYDDWTSVLSALDRNNEPRFLDRQGPELGFWNYPDALFTGNGGMTDIEYRSMFALWCAVKAPLMLGSDLREMTREDVSYETITNTELIAINQDPMGKQARCVKDCCGDDPLLGGNIPQVTCENFNDVWQVWQGPLDGESYVVVVVNRFDTEVNIELDWSLDAQIPAGSYSVRDLWKQEDLESIQVGEDVFSGTLDIHDNWSFKLTPITGEDDTSTTTENVASSNNISNLIVCLLAFSVWKFRTTL